ncbi:thiamin biosynthesis protein (Thi-4) [Protomyces lactucae-debilis]|uniref:Thiamin biosynthesis protein (Thi-4) n=1 Tax=Protomyces lactucae-debilis TaxID=2754530 RepID=A0A1Y2FDR7_PROLT|nr:thiamine biosynthesis protein (Thi-4) [Protomyces lactucae-debilis]ORY81574.1 thiamin biosynthesis protein (Thi-4) [Protomyces lactucae-debilis]
MIARVLTVAGSDSGGGAGIQADLKVMTAHNVYGMSVITAVTSQNTLAVDAVQLMDAEMLEKQFRSVVSDLGCDAVKTGMLGDRKNVIMLASLLREYKLNNLVVDPVMVATTGARLLSMDAVEAYMNLLLPIAQVVTPNLEEARLLLAEARGVPFKSVPAIDSVEAMRQAAKELSLLGPKYVLVKGGHLPLNEHMHKQDSPNRTGALVADVLYGADTFHVMVSKWSPSRNTHGTGCSLASAIACQLAQGKGMPEACQEAISYVHGAIQHSFDLGSGSGPLNHMYRMSQLPFTPGAFIDFLIKHPKVQPAWTAYTEHSFVKGLQDGSLPLDAFKKFLRQDYLYLVQYARLTALAAYKCDRLEDIAGSARVILHIEEELKLHVSYCQSFGISKAELENGQESIACTVYTRYIESIGNSKDWLSLQVALAACLVGYGAVGERLAKSPKTDRSSVYWAWIQNYAADDYTQAVKTGRALSERHAMQCSPSKVEELVEIFRRVTEYEANFWTSAMESDNQN